MALSAAQLKQLAGSAEFNAVIASDPVIRDLEAQKRNHPLERMLLVEALGGALSVAGIPVLPLTPAKWAVLYMTQNSFVTLRDCHTDHVDQFMWLLTHDLADLDGFDSLPDIAKDYCSVNHIDMIAAIEDILQVAEMALYPLRMLPTVAGGDPPEYDAEWLTRICCAASEVSGVPVPELMHRTALSTVCYYFVAEQRKKDVKDVIRKPSDRDIESAIRARIRILSEEYIYGSRSKNHPE